MEPDPPVGFVEPSPSGSAVWDEITHMVSVSMLEGAPDVWLGQVVLEAQKASDRAVAWARSRAEALVADARVEGDRIRDQGHQRAQAMSYLQDFAERLAVERSAQASPPSVASAPPAPPVRLLPPPSGPPVLPDTGPTPLLPARAAPSGSSGGSATVALVPPPPTSPSVLYTVGPTLLPTQAEPSRATPAGPTSFAPPILPGQAPSWPPGPQAASPEDRPTQAGPAVRRSRSRWWVLLTVVGVVAVAFGLVALSRSETSAQERGSQRQLVQEFANLEATRRPVLPPTDGGVFGLLSVPRLGMNGVAVVDGDTQANLRKGPAYDASSQLPGHPGAVVILGHRRLYGAPLARLGGLRIGDLISLRTTSGLYAYRVSLNPQVLGSRSSNTLQLPSAAQVRASGGNPQGVDQALVLATSAGSGDSPLRVVVATPDQSSEASESPLASGAAPPDTVLRAVPGETIALVWLAFWLVAIGTAVAWAFGQRSRLPVALISGVVVVVVLLAGYQMFQAISRFVPGTY